MEKRGFSGEEPVPAPPTQKKKQKKTKKTGGMAIRGRKKTG